MNTSSTVFPRGVLAGTCLAVLLAVPLFVAISLDAESRPISGRLTNVADGSRSRAQPVVSSGKFFAGQITVKVFMARRPIAGKATSGRVSNKDVFLGPMTGDQTANAGQPRSSETLQVRVENDSAKDLEVEVLEARSDLGDLAGGLGRMRLVPGQTAQTGMAIASEHLPTTTMPVQVSMRLGGQEERRELVLPAPLVARAHY